MDVSSVHHNGALLQYSVSLLGYGFYGDIIRDSEKKRWMGLIRYDFSGDSEACALGTSGLTARRPREAVPRHRPKPGPGPAAAAGWRCAWPVPGARSVTGRRLTRPRRGGRDTCHRLRPHR